MRRLVGRVFGGDVHRAVRTPRSVRLRAFAVHVHVPSGARVPMSNARSTVRDVVSAWVSMTIAVPIQPHRAVAKRAIRGRAGTLRRQHRRFPQYLDSLSPQTFSPMVSLRLRTPSLNVQPTRSKSPRLHFRGRPGLHFTVYAPPIRCSFWPTIWTASSNRDSIAACASSTRSSARGRRSTTSRSSISRRTTTSG